MNKPLAKKKRLWQCTRMARHLPLIVYALSLALCAAADLSTAVPSGLFDTAAFHGGWLANAAHNDSRYALPVSVEAYENQGGTFCDIALALRTAPSGGEAWVSFGSAASPHDLRVGIARGNLYVIAKGDALPLSHALPPGSLHGDQTVSLRIRISASGNILAVASTPEPAYVSPLHAWQGMNPSLWDAAELSLRGAGSAVGRVFARRHPQGTLLIVR